MWVYQLQCSFHAITESLSRLFPQALQVNVFSGYRPRSLPFQESGPVLLT